VLEFILETCCFVFRRNAMIRGAIFDVDGTIGDTEEKKQLELQKLRAQLGLTSQTISPGAVGGDLPGMDIALHLGMEYDEFIAPLYATAWANVQLKPGVMELVYGTRALGLATGISSLGYRGRVMPLLQKFNLQHAFNAITLVDDIQFTAQNPAPKRQVVLETLRKLGLSASEVLAFEDSPSGVNGFLEAGVPAERIIVIPNQLTMTKAFPEGVRRLNSMLDAIPLDRFIASFNG
jgi:putative hydrolase of the HAD superfamily